MYYIPEEQPRSGSCGVVVLFLVFGAIVLFVFLSAAGWQEENTAMAQELENTDEKIATLEAENRSLKETGSFLENEVANLRSIVTVLESEKAQALADLEALRQAAQLAQAEADRLAEENRQLIANANMHLYIPSFQVGAGLPVGSNIGGGSVDPAPNNLPNTGAQPELANINGQNQLILGLLASVATAGLVIFSAVGAALWRQRRPKESPHKNGQIALY